MTCLLCRSAIGDQPTEKWGAGLAHKTCTYAFQEGVRQGQLDGPPVFKTISGASPQAIPEKTINGRVIRAYELSGLNLDDWCSLIGSHPMVWQQGIVGRIFAAGTPMLCRILNAFPEIDAHWLMTGIVQAQTSREPVTTEVDQLRRALEFYAQDGNWKRPTAGRRWRNSTVADDRGSRARTVLFGLGEG